LLIFVKRKEKLKAGHSFAVNQQKCALMKWILVWGMIISGFMSNAQQGQAPKQEPAYKRFPTIPALELLRPDSTKFTKDDLKKQNTLIMYFSPDCDHCNPSNRRHD
jgi:hypothetical protein